MKSFCLLIKVKVIFSQGKGESYQESNTSSPVTGQAAACPEAGGRQAATGRKEKAREGENDERD